MILPGFLSLFSVFETKTNDFTRWKPYFIFNFKI